MKDRTVLHNDGLVHDTVQYIGYDDVTMMFLACKLVPVRSKACHKTPQQITCLACLTQ